MITLHVAAVCLILTLFFKCRLQWWGMHCNWWTEHEWIWVMRIMSAYIHLKQLKATWDFLPQLHPVLTGYHVRLKLCTKTMTLLNYVKWVDVLMHIHIRVMGKSVNVKVVNWLANLHIATITFSHSEAFASVQHFATAKGLWSVKHHTPVAVLWSLSTVR